MAANNTIFDDVFRTMMEKMPSLVIPVINEVFHTEYREDEPVEQYRNEHHTRTGEIITDSCLGIRDRLYHIECQSSPDSTMSIRMIEYDFATAIDRAEKNGNNYEINFPDSCVLYLRHNSSTPDHLKVTVNFPNGEKYVYRTPTVKVQNYTSDELFRKRLLFFLPFYIMRYEKQITEIGKSPEKLNEFIAEFESIRSRLDNDLSIRKETELYTRLMELIKEVSDYILEPEPEVRERIDGIMGGKILELETDRILERGYKRGIEQGIEQGVEQGAEQEKLSVVKNMLGKNLSPEEVSQYTGYDMEDILKVQEQLQEKNVTMAEPERRHPHRGR